MVAKSTLVLGSASPRRSALLADLGIAFEVAVVDIDEQSYQQSQDAVASVIAIAAAKFAAFNTPDADRSVTLLTADTLVACGVEIMGKPGTESELVDMLKRMDGQSITIITAVCVGAPGTAPMVEAVTTTVQLRRLTDTEIDLYVQAGVGMDKAGGLALQAEAGPFIESVNGCWSNVLGLPVCAVAAALQLAPGGDRTERCSVELCGSHW